MLSQLQMKYLNRKQKLDQNIFTLLLFGLFLKWQKSQLDEMSKDKFDLEKKEMFWNLNKHGRRKKSRNLPAEVVVVIFKRITVNFSNLILVFLFATCCIKVGDNEEIYHPSCLLSNKIHQKVFEKGHLIEKCLALIRCQTAKERGRRNSRSKNNKRKKKDRFY